MAHCHVVRQVFRLAPALAVASDHGAGDVRALRDGLGPVAAHACPLVGRTNLCRQPHGGVACRSCARRAFGPPQLRVLHDVGGSAWRDDAREWGGRRGRAAMAPVWCFPDPVPHAGPAAPGGRCRSFFGGVERHAARRQAGRDDRCVGHGKLHTRPRSASAHQRRAVPPAAGRRRCVRVLVRRRGRCRVPLRPLLPMLRPLFGAYQGRAVPRTACGAADAGVLVARSCAAAPDGRLGRPRTPVALRPLRHRAADAEAVCVVSLAAARTVCALQIRIAWPHDARRRRKRGRLASGSALSAHDPDGAGRE